MCEISCDLKHVKFYMVKYHMWKFHMFQTHMWRFTWNHIWSSFTCEDSHEITCEIPSDVNYNFTLFHMRSHDFTCVISCGIFVKEILEFYYFWKVLSGNFVFFTWSCLHKKSVYNANCPLILTTDCVHFCIFSEIFYSLKLLKLYLKDMKNPQILDCHFE